MKIVLEDGDLEYIKKINQNLLENKEHPIFCSEKKNYSFSFDVRDIAKANAFVLFLMDPKMEKQIEDTAGIRAISVGSSMGDRKLHSLKNMLQEFLENLERI